MCQLFQVGCSFFVVVFIFGILLMASIRRWWWDKSGFFFGMVIWINRKGQKNGSVSWMCVLFDWMIFSVSIELFLCACNKLSSILYGHLHTHNTKKIAPHVFYYTLTFSWNCTHCCCCCMPTIFEKKLMSIQIYSFTQFVTKHWDKQNERKFNNKIMVIHCNHFVCVCVCALVYSVAWSEPYALTHWGIFRHATIQTKEKCATIRFVVLLFSLFDKTPVSYWSISKNMWRNRCARGTWNAIICCIWRNILHLSVSRLVDIRYTEIKQCIGSVENERNNHVQQKRIIEKGKRTCYCVCYFRIPKSPSDFSPFHILLYCFVFSDRDRNVYLSTSSICLFVGILLMSVWISFEAMINNNINNNSNFSPKWTW